MKYKENIQDLLLLQPDFIGFIFYPKSPRYAKDELQPFDLNNLVIGATKVGVFVNEKINAIMDIAKWYQLDAIQLHGAETPQDCKELKNKGFIVIKAFSIETHFDFSHLQIYKPYVDYFLFDTKSTGYGGTGKKFDWKILDNYDDDIPYFLSGGIDAGDAGSIRKLIDRNLQVIDINSRFEKAPALKDIQKIKEFKSELVLANLM